MLNDRVGNNSRQKGKIVRYFVGYKELSHHLFRWVGEEVKHSCRLQFAPGHVWQCTSALSVNIRTSWRLIFAPERSTSFLRRLYRYPVCFVSFASIAVCSAWPSLGESAVAYYFWRCWLRWSSLVQTVRFGRSFVNGLLKARWAFFLVALQSFFSFCVKASLACQCLKGLSGHRWLQMSRWGSCHTISSCAEERWHYEAET